LVSGLKVNFYKSKLYGWNIEDTFLAAASNFLYCSIDKAPFRFLGLPVGANPRRFETWKPVINSLKNKLTVWKGKNLSIGGMLVLINSVLSSLPVFFFSFYKAPKKVITDLTHVQRRFLWGGDTESSKVCWVKWDNVCLPKEEGGLGVKNLLLFNFAMFNKWRRRILNDHNNIWSNLIKFRYGDVSQKLLRSDCLDINAADSLWWKDLLLSGFIEEGEANWFKSLSKWELGNGESISFWNDLWCGDLTLKERFYDMYQLSQERNSKVCNMGEWYDGLWAWNLRWSRPLDTEELARFGELKRCICSATGQRQTRDILC
jgi:hypothetical protein